MNMKKMKRLLALALALTLVLALSACGGKDSGGDTKYVKDKGTLMREEVELPLTEEQYTRLSSLLCACPIRKDFREYLLPDGTHLECSLVDEGEPTCFMYAEIEFDSLEQAQSYPAPDCVGREVTAGGYGMAGYWNKTRA